MAEMRDYLTQRGGERGGKRQKIKTHKRLNKNTISIGQPQTPCNFFHTDAFVLAMAKQY